MEVSVVVPANNEEANVERLCKTLTDVLDKTRKSYEIIIVDDGSTDKTFGILKSLHSKDNRIKVIRLARRCGQSPALTAGFANSKGEVVVTTDADLQNDPQDIPALLKKMAEGYDVVSGWRYDRKDNFFIKIIPSRIFNWLTRNLTGINIHDGGCTLKAYRGDAVRKVKVLGQTHRLLPSLVYLAGYKKITEMKVRHHPRVGGETRYKFLFGRYSLANRFFQWKHDVMAIRHAMKTNGGLTAFEKQYPTKKIYEIAEKLL